MEPSDILILGELLGFKMWEKLSTEEQKRMWKESKNNDYHSYSLFNNEDLPPLICFKRVGKGHKNDYILNLKTMKPTKKSPNKKIITLDQIERFKTQLMEV